MGLDISHDTWHGAYSAFMRWRKEIARLAGFPPLDLMEGFYIHTDNPFTLLDYKYPTGDELEYYRIRELKQYLPIKWDLFETHPLTELLYHSDCDGDISYGKCRNIADALEKLLPLMSTEPIGGHIGDYRSKTETFIKGLRDAHSKKEKLVFH